MPIPFVVDGVWIPRAIVGIRSRFAVPLYLELRRHCYEEPSCFPGVRRLARLVGCSIGTVSALTDQFDALGILKKMHDGRRCLYKFAADCWRRRKLRHARKSAHCSAGRTEDRIPIRDSIVKKGNHKNNRVSLDASQQLETRNKRSNMIRSLRQWVTLSPCLPDAEREHRLAMLDQAEAHLDCWYARPAEDRRCFELLVHRARAMPLEARIEQSLRQRPVGMAPIGAVLLGPYGVPAAYFR